LTKKVDELEKMFDELLGKLTKIEKLFGTLRNSSGY
jgi:hypothetical protein